MRSVDIERASALLDRLKARATGLWRVDGEGAALVQKAFVAAPDMPAEAAEAFADATLRVPLDRVDLGIVQAALGLVPAVSRVDTGDSGEGGSGYWLRRFGAVRSVAVPLFDESGNVRAVFSAAVGPDDRGDGQIAAIVREIAEATGLGTVQPG